MSITPVIPILCLPPNLFLYMVASGISSLGLAVAANGLLEGADQSESRVAIEATKVLRVLDKVALNGSFGKGIALWIFSWSILAIGLGLQYFNNASLLNVSDPDALLFEIKPDVHVGNESGKTDDSSNSNREKPNSLVRAMITLATSLNNNSAPKPISTDQGGQTTGSPLKLDGITFKLAHPTIVNRYVGKISGKETLSTLAELANDTGINGNELTS